MSFANALTGLGDWWYSCGTPSLQVISSNQGQVNRVKCVLGICASPSNHIETIIIPTALTGSLQECGKDQRATDIKLWYSHSFSELVLEGCTNFDIWMPPSTTGLRTKVFNLLLFSGMHEIQLNKNAACYTSVINELKLPSKSRRSTFSNLLASRTENKHFSTFLNNISSTSLRSG